MSEATALTNAATIRDKVADRIKSMFVELIPDEQWKTLVQNEINEFSSATRESYYPHRKTGPSPLATIICKELEAMFHEKVKVELAKPEYQGDWTGSGRTPSDFVTQFLKDNAGVLVAAALGSMTQEILETVQRSVLTR